MNLSQWHSSLSSRSNHRLYFEDDQLLVNTKKNQKSSRISPLFLEMSNKLDTLALQTSTPHLNNDIVVSDLPSPLEILTTIEDEIDVLYKTYNKKTSTKWAKLRRRFSKKCKALHDQTHVNYGLLKLSITAKKEQFTSQTEKLAALNDRETILNSSQESTKKIKKIISKISELVDTNHLCRKDENEKNIHLDYLSTLESQHKYLSEKPVSKEINKNFENLLRDLTDFKNELKQNINNLITDEKICEINNNYAQSLKASLDPLSFSLDEINEIARTYEIQSEGEKFSADFKDIEEQITSFVDYSEENLKDSFSAIQTKISNLSDNLRLHLTKLNQLKTKQSCEEIFELINLMEKAYVSLETATTENKTAYECQLEALTQQIQSLLKKFPAQDILGISSDIITKSSKYDLNELFVLNTKCEASVEKVNQAIREEEERLRNIPSNCLTKARNKIVAPIENSTSSPEEIFENKCQGLGPIFAPLQLVQEEQDLFADLAGALNEMGLNLPLKSIKDLNLALLELRLHNEDLTTLLKILEQNASWRDPASTLHHISLYLNRLPEKLRNIEEDDLTKKIYCNSLSRSIKEIINNSKEISTQINSILYRELTKYAESFWQQKIVVEEDKSLIQTLLSDYLRLLGFFIQKLETNDPQIDHLITFIINFTHPKMKNETLAQEVKKLKDELIDLLKQAIYLEVFLPHFITNHQADHYDSFEESSFAGLYDVLSIGSDALYEPEYNKILKDNVHFLFPIPSDPKKKNGDENIIKEGLKNIFMDISRIALRDPKLFKKIIQSATKSDQNDPTKKTEDTEKEQVEVEKIANISMDILATVSKFQSYLSTLVTNPVGSRLAGFGIKRGILGTIDVLSKTSKTKIETTEIKSLATILSENEDHVSAMIQLRHQYLLSLSKFGLNYLLPLFRKTIEKHNFKELIQSLKIVVTSIDTAAQLFKILKDEANSKKETNPDNRPPIKYLDKQFDEILRLGFNNIDSFVGEIHKVELERSFFYAMRQLVEILEPREEWTAHGYDDALGQFWNLFIQNLGGPVSEQIESEEDNELVVNGVPD